MSQIRIIISLVLINVFLMNLCSTSLLLVDHKNPCRAYGNASVYDITNLVKKWPVGLRGPGVGGEYVYWWSCGGITRKCKDNDIAVCQQPTSDPIVQFNAGNVSPQLWFGVFNGPEVEVNFNKSPIFNYTIFNFYLTAQSHLGYNVSKCAIKSIIYWWYRYSSYDRTFYS